MHAEAASPAAGERRSYRYYSLIMAAFVTVLICSNTIGPAKVCELQLPLLGTLVFGAGNIFFPLSYIFGDVLTEVYGYARARKVIWAGFGAMLFVTLMSTVIIHLPPSPSAAFNEQIQPALELVFGNTWRITVGSILAFWIGDFANSFVLARMKVLTRGRWLWTRTIGSTIVGQGIDSVVFYPIAFSGIWSDSTMTKVIIFNWVFKVSIEVLFTPLTYLTVNWLKRAEHEDFYDYETDFTPFSLRD
jgi:uncharacterized integral membrane protein (TIGR00697 family)